MRRIEAEEIRKALLQVSVWAAQAWNGLGKEGDLVRQAMALLEEARNSLPSSPRAKPPKLQRAAYPWPEALLYWGLAGLQGVKRRLEKGLRARAVPLGTARALELIKAAEAHLQEAWLSYLYAHGMPLGYRPVQALPWSVGPSMQVLTAAALGLATEFALKGASPTFPGWRYLSMAVIIGWAALITVVLRRLCSPRGGQRPQMVSRRERVQRLVPSVLIVAAAPALGILAHPDWTGLFVALSITSLGVGFPLLIRALQLLRFPAARILVLPGIDVVFLPRLSSVPKEKVFP